MLKTILLDKLKKLFYGSKCGGNCGCQDFIEKLMEDNSPDSMGTDSNLRRTLHELNYHPPIEIINKRYSRWGKDYEEPIHGQITL